MRASPAVKEARAERRRPTAHTPAHTHVHECVQTGLRLKRKQMETHRGGGEVVGMNERDERRRRRKAHTKSRDGSNCDMRDTK